MDQDLREAFATLSAQGAETNAHARTAADRALDASLGVRRLEGRVERLEKHVFGSEPPPDTGSAIVRQVSEHDSELATLAGQVIATNAKVDTTIAKVNKLTEMQQEQTKTLKSINDAVGGFLSNPKVRRLAYLAYIGIVGYLATRGIQ